MMQFSIGVSALQAAQRALDITGHNIANANTPGYHRQIPKLASQPAMQLDGLAIGRGVELVDIQRAVSQQLETSMTLQVAENGAADVRLSAMRRWSLAGRRKRLLPPEGWRCSSTISNSCRPGSTIRRREEAVVSTAVSTAAPSSIRSRPTCTG